MEGMEKDEAVQYCEYEPISPQEYPTYIDVNSTDFSKNEDDHINNRISSHTTVQQHEEEKKKRIDNTSRYNLTINPLSLKNQVDTDVSSIDEENNSDLGVKTKESDASEIHCLNFNVKASLKLNSRRGHRILELTCESVVAPNKDNIEALARESFSSGSLGDVSQTQSTTSGLSVQELPLPPSWATRASEVSTSSCSSGGSQPKTTLAVPIQQHLPMNYKHNKPLSIKRIEELREKWCRSDFVYNVLDFIDSCVGTIIDTKEENKKNDVDKKLVSKKRHIADDNHKPFKKRIRAFHIDPSICITVIGKEVFARCENGNYYYGLVTGVTKTGQLDVDFSDAKHMYVDVEDSITSISSLMCHNVMVVGENEQETYPAIISEYFTNSFPCKFSVISDYGDSVVEGSQIYLTEAQASAVYESSISTTNNDIAISGPSGLQSFNSLDNREFGAGRYSSDDMSHALSDIRAGRYAYNPSSSDSEEPLSKQTDMNIYKYVVGCDMEASNAGLVNSLLKLKGIAGKVPKYANEYEDRVLGPLTVSGNWFKGLNFILTCSIQNLLAPDVNEDDGSDTNNTDNEDYVFSRVPYISDRLAQQIRLGGGRVLTTFEEVESVLYSETYLVTNRPCITARFLKCLALGITIACHEWIINCTVKQKRLMVQELPAGWSIENGVFITMYQRKAPRPFNGLRIQLAQYSDPNFISFWTDICRSMGSSVVVLKRLDKSCNVVVAEDGYHGILVDEANALEIPVVSAAWVVQSLVYGESRPYEGHVTFNHLYEEIWEY